ncbi:MAG: carbohydrate ABC transporter permease [Eubacteriales bacterium]
MKQKKELAKSIVMSLFLGLIAIIMVFPVVWMLSASFKYEADVFTIPIQWIPENVNYANYTKAFTEYPFLQWYINTFLVAIMVVAFILLFSSLTGYAFAKLNFSGKNILFALFISTLMIPNQVRIIPQFLIFKEFGLLNTLLAVSLPWVFNGFAIFLMRQFFTSIPDELIEAARIDGSNEYRTFFQIVLPLAKSQLAALFILAFTWGWNEYLSPLIYISDVNKQVLSVGIATFKSQYSANFAIQMAGATLALLPIIAVYLCAQKYFIQGVALSGVKG